MMSILSIFDSRREERRIHFGCWRGKKGKAEYYMPLLCTGLTLFSEICSVSMFLLGVFFYFPFLLQFLCCCFHYFLCLLPPFQFLSPLSPLIIFIRSFLWGVFFYLLSLLLFLCPYFSYFLCLISVSVFISSLSPLLFLSSFCAVFHLFLLMCLCPYILYFLCLSCLRSVFISFISVIVFIFFSSLLFLYTLLYISICGITSIFFLSLVLFLSFYITVLYLLSISVTVSLSFLVLLLFLCTNLLYCFYILWCIYLLISGTASIVFLFALVSTLFISVFFILLSPPPFLSPFWSRYFYLLVGIIISITLSP